MITEQISTPMWLEIKAETRHKLATVLNLSKSGTTELINMPTYTRIVCDGYTNQDLAGITIEKLKTLTGETGSLTELLNILINQLENRETVLTPALEQEKELPQVVDNVVDNQTTETPVAEEPVVAPELVVEEPQQAVESASPAIEQPAKPEVVAPVESPVVEEVPQPVIESVQEETVPVEPSSNENVVFNEPAQEEVTEEPVVEQSAEEIAPESSIEDAPVGKATKTKKRSRK